MLCGLLLSATAYAEPTISSCRTILSSLHTDYAATKTLFERYGVTAEQNPIIRALGPDFYFVSWTVGLLATCRETTAWRVASVAIWAIQTFYVNTHISLGTAQGVPLLYFSIRF